MSSTVAPMNTAGWFRRTPMGGWSLACLAILLVAGAAYYFWFALQHGGVPSSSPFVWAQFATYWAGITIPILLAVAVAATISQRRGEAEADALDTLLREIKSDLDDALPPLPASPHALDVAEKRAGLIADRAGLAILSWPREFPAWARPLIALKFEGFLIQIGGSQVPPLPLQHWVPGTGASPWDSRFNVILRGAS
jgi:hypothetical protein